MAMNPDDLLIFKVREEDKEPANKQKGKKATMPEQTQLQQSKPVEKVEKPSFFKPKEPEQPQPKQQEKPKPVMPEPPVEVTPPEPITEGDESYYVAPAEEMDAGPGSVDYVSRAAEYSGDSKDFPEQEQPQQPKKPILKKREHMDSRKIAQHMSCELHPWRRAYAICDYCKRAFCYEDILEVGGKYYCLDDVDKVPEDARRRQVIKYNNLSMIASVLYMVAFVVFFFYSYNSILVLLDAIGRIGLPLFMTQLNMPRELLIGEMVLALLALGTAISILLSNSSSFKMSALVSLVSVAVFGYNVSTYAVIQNAPIQMIAFAALAFVAFVILSYSRVSTESMPEEEALLEKSLVGTSNF